MYQPLKAKMVHYAINHPKKVIWAMALSTVLIVAVAALPSLFPQYLPQLHRLTVDTDPENMLSKSEPVRIFHEQAKERFNLHDMVVVGVVNRQHPQGAFNAATLEKVYQLTEFAKGLQWTGPSGDKAGVVSIDLMAPSTVDNIEQGGLGSVNFSWLMSAPPKDDAEALTVLKRAQKIPFLNGTLVSEDGEVLALYLPITSKDVAYRIRAELMDFTGGWAAQGDEVHITGLPIAEDTFGVEMFIQMAVSAPLAMLVIFLLLWWFFKKLVLVASPMILALVCSLATMGLLIITGNTIHIMSSMIPIFIMPIAVLDAVHILSEFFDVYPKHKDRSKTIEHIYDELFAPMLFTTLTTMAGFGSLMLTPIPPVQTFGLFVTIGVFVAWLWTMLFIPAYIMCIPESKLQGYGEQSGQAEDTLFNRVLQGVGNFSSSRPAIIGMVALVLVGVAIYGIGKINVNDNPTRWFDSEHPIRIADRVLNQHFGGTYMAYLELSAGDSIESLDRDALEAGLRDRMQQGAQTGNPADPYQQAIAQISHSQGDSDLLERLNQLAEDGVQSAEGDEYYSWDDIQLFLDEQRQQSELFKQPDTLRWMEQLQQFMLAEGSVGKVNSLTDVVKTVYRELQLGELDQFRIPDTSSGVAQTLITYQNSHRPHDLWHFVTPDFRRSVLWMQMPSGDNQDMERVMRRLDLFLAENPAPHQLQSNWFGLTYINVTWQGKMVTGMLEAFLGSFVVVLIMMVFLFRSVSWGLIAMIPLVITVGLIYGIIGLIGKDYDMPVAILSALSLGLAVDYAIHFIARARESVAACGSWQKSISQMFGEPARAISRNAIVLGAGFMPLLAAPLVPYQTVGVFIAAIIISAAIVTLVLLPAIMTLLQNFLFRQKEQ